MSLRPQSLPLGGPGVKRNGEGGPPIFVVGCGRSGTTMLRLMLDAHDDLAIPGESHFIRKLYRMRRRFLRPDGSVDATSLASAVMQTPHFRRWELPENLVWRRVETLDDPTFPSVLEAFFRAYAELHGKPRWGDKTPVYVRSIPVLAQLFPQARFVHIIRDGRDVALSYLSVPWGPRNIWEVARKWRREVSGGRAAGAALGDDRYLEVRYEDLVGRTRDVLHRVCDFADLPFEEHMLDFHTQAVSRLEAGPQGPRFHGSVTKPPTPGLRDWRTEMTESQLLAFEAVAGRLLAELGYQRRLDRIPLAWRARAALWLVVLRLWVTGAVIKRWRLERRESRSLGRTRPGLPLSWTGE
ncbi:MAG: sulfotransferase family protein [Acidimicrobiia bacterium]